MSITFQQEDTAPSCTQAAYCSGLGNSTPLIEQFAIEGGTAGTTEDNSGNFVNADATIFRVLYYDLQIPSGMFGETGDAGDWTVNINHTTGNANVDIEEVHICRINSSCANQETLGSTTAIATATNGAQPVSVTVTQGSNTSVATDDRVIIVVGYQNNAAHGNQSIGVTPDATVVCPWTVPAGAGPAAGLRTLALTGVGV